MQILSGWIYLPVPYFLKRFIEWLGDDSAEFLEGAKWSGLIILCSILVPVVEVVSDVYARPCRVHNLVSMMVKTLDLDGPN